MSDKKEANAAIEAEDVQEVTPHNRALYEAGRKLLVDSVDVGREFCKFMTTTALGAIPTYIALLKLILPKDYSLQHRDEIRFLLPPILFLLSSVLFVIGYFPQKGTISLDLPSDIERERNTTIRRRYRYAIGAFSVFCLGTAYAFWLLVAGLLT